MTSAKKTEGERIAPSFFPNSASLQSMLSREIDRAIRRAQEKAWDACHLWLNDNPDATNAAMNKANPYRGKAKR